VAPVPTAFFLEWVPKLTVEEALVNVVPTPNTSATAGVNLI
jgi:hypothetical protein